MKYINNEKLNNSLLGIVNIKLRNLVLSEVNVYL